MMAKKKNPSGCPEEFRGKRGPEVGERRKMCEVAGISRHQMYQAIQVSRIPEEEFARLVDGDGMPPTVTELARIGSGQPPKPKKTKCKFCPHCGGEL